MPYLHGEGFLLLSLLIRSIFSSARLSGGDTHMQKVTSLSELLRNADEKLFTKMRSSNHSVHHQLLPAKTLPMKLRSTLSVFALPQCNYNLYKSSFVLRNLFLDAYWNILFTPCLSLLSDGVCLLELKGLLTYVHYLCAILWSHFRWSQRHFLFIRDAKRDRRLEYARPDLTCCRSCHLEGTFCNIKIHMNK